jgi:peptidoglycan/xylan/chitin deacetylase (PgdA/CDA1 family)
MDGFTFAERVRLKLAHHIPLGRTPMALERGALSITFDDFPQSAWRVGGKVLAEHSVRASYYVCGGLMGRVYRDLPHFDVEDLKEVHAAGHEIGCHTFDHLSVLREPAARIDASLMRNRDFIATHLPDCRLRTFAYPFGEVSLSGKRRLARRFEACRGIVPRLNGPAAELTLLAAVPMEERQRDNFDVARLIAEAAAERRWLIVFTHDVSERPSPYGCRPEELGRLVVAAKNAGLMIAPVATVLEVALAASPHPLPDSP